MMNSKKPLIAVIFLMTYLLGASVPLIVQAVSVSGQSIFMVQGADEYLSALLWAISLAFIITLFRVPWVVKRTYLQLWGLKCIVTLVVMLFYESAYNLDAYEYFKNIMIERHLQDLKFGNGTAFVLHLGIFLNHILSMGDSYHTFKVIWSFFGFLAIIPFYNIYRLVSQKENIKVLWAIGAFPSVLFWTSILGKDPISILGVACAAYGLVRSLKKFDLTGLVYATLGLLLLSYIRIWLAPIFLAPAVLSFAWGKSSKVIWRMIGTAIIAYALVYVSVNLQNMLQLTNADDAVERLSYVSSAWARGGSSLEAPVLNSLTDVVRFLPLGFFTALFRPLPGDVFNFFGILASIESLIILFIVGRVIFTTKKQQWRHPYVIYCCSAIVIWGLFYAFVSYQNLGTAVRFRAQILPFIILLPFIVKELAANQRTKKKKPMYLMAEDKHLSNDESDDLPDPKLVIKNSGVAGDSFRNAR